MATRKITIPAYKPSEIPTREVLPPAPALESYDDGMEMGIDEVEQVHPDLEEHDLIGAQVPGELQEEVTDEPYELHGAEMDEENPLINEVTPPVRSQVTPFVAPEGYILVEKSMYQLMKMALERSLSGEFTARKAEVPVEKPAIRLRVVRGCHIGDINKAVSASDDPNHEIEWVPNQHIKISGQKYEKMDSFLVLFNKQNPYSQAYKPNDIHHFSILNPDVFHAYFKKKTAAEVRGQTTPNIGAPPVRQTLPTAQEITRRSDLPPVGSEERKAFFLQRSPHGSPVKMTMPTPPTNAPERIQDIPVNRGQNAGRQTVRTISDPKFKAEDTNNPLAAMMMKAQRQGG